MTSPTSTIRLNDLGGSQLATTKALNKLRDDALENAKHAQEQAQLDELEHDQQIVLQLIEPIATTLESKPRLVVGSDYARCYRGVAYHLPEDLKFTVRGAKIVNSVLERITATAALMAGPWKERAEANVEDMRKHEETRKADTERRKTEDLQIVENLRKEIIYLLNAKPQIMDTMRSGRVTPRVKYYTGLFKHLRELLNHPYRGSRGVRCIHEAMRLQLAWSIHWDDWMEKDYKLFVTHEKERAAQIKAAHEEAKRSASKPRDESVTLSQEKDISAEHYNCSLSQEPVTSEENDSTNTSEAATPELDEELDTIASEPESSEDLTSSAHAE